MPNSEDPRQAVKKRMSFSQKFSKLTGIGRNRDKEEKHHSHDRSSSGNASKDDAQRSSTLSNASTTSEASTVSTAPSEASTATSVAHSLPPTREKYCTLRLTDDLAITIGDAFEPNPKSTLDDAWDFAYGPIRWPKFLRLVLVFPAVYPGEPLETLLFHADLHEVPFRMLKYERGDEDRMMHVNGMKRLVSRGLHDALIAVRERARGNSYTVLWLDELCVNQDDPVERDAHVRLKRDIVSACVGKTAVDSALNANFKRGREGRVSVDATDSDQQPQQHQPMPSAYQRPRGRNTSNASDLSGSTEIALSSRWQSRAQSVASMRTTERIGPSDSEGSSNSATDDDEADDADEDRKGKKPEKVSRRSRKRSPRRFKSPNPGSKPPRISLTFDTPLRDKFEDLDLKKEREKPYHVMRSQPL
ncbi:hypothetical protein B0T11DRAFT_9456 [Plectosphaerella cucumerina]|uniref:Heterokaryon incompatibility domain-containing protein n=1 Tax=Plectosphaerella cucumerina TaxID=40658 RepID=A0A8K0TRQ0_9PEZI|nr:hypothetical protein B0T11DRAFT_9456 [Plectosphaerella cucumerina]